MKETAKNWRVSERSVRNYCRSGRVDKAELRGTGWQIPSDAVKPERLNGRKPAEQDVLTLLRAEKQARIPGGLYHRLQVDMTYNSNHIEGSTLTHEQTRYIFETNTVVSENQEGLMVDDIVETANHFRCIDMVIDNALQPLSEHFIKQLHGVLKSGTTDSRKNWFAVGGYKKLSNFIGGDIPTTPPGKVAAAIRKLLLVYDVHKQHTFEEILDFHYQFEKIHPFQDGNGRVGRLILLKECLRSAVVPFIIEDGDKYYYYRGLQEYGMGSRDRLRDVFLHSQDKFKVLLAKYLTGV
ncbi:MAG: Fic family protein [Acidaminococcaceae bacterium]|nr:Fic family protein [Acidaminococcaceae bacterium]